MANSYQRATSDGTMTFIDVSIGYLERSEISVYFDDVITTAWAWSGSVDKRILFSPAIAAGVVVMVKRLTDAAVLRHAFSEGAAFTATSLDEDLKQALYISQEAREANLVGDYFVDINMHGHAIRNLQDGVNPSDAVTMRQYQADSSGPYQAAAAAAASAAEAAANATYATSGGVTRQTPQRLGDRHTVNDYGALVNAVSGFNTMAAALGFVTVPAGVVYNVTGLVLNVPIYFEPGAAVTVDSGGTCTIRAQITSPAQFIFRGAGEYSLEHNSGSTGEEARQVDVSWFGARPYSGSNPVDQAPFFAKACRSVGNLRESVIDVGLGGYTILSAVPLTRCAWIRGAGSRRTVFRVSGDGFIPLYTTEQGVRISGVQFEHDPGGATRNSPYISILHDGCEIEDVFGGHGVKHMIVVNANRTRIREVSVAYGYAPPTGGSVVNIIGGSQNTIDGVIQGTSAFAPDSLVLLGGPDQARTVGTTLVRRVRSVGPYAGVRLAAATGFAVVRSRIEDVLLEPLSAGGTDAVQIVNTGGTISNIQMDGINISANAASALNISTTSGTTQDIDVLSGTCAGATGTGIVYTHTGGTSARVTIHSGFNAQVRATPVSITGTQTGIYVAPTVLANTMHGNSVELSVADDTAVFIPVLKTRLLNVTVGTATHAIGCGIYTGPSPAWLRHWTIPDTASVGLVTGALTGTTGTDGNITVGAVTNGFWVENRLGGNRVITITYN